MDNRLGIDAAKKIRIKEWFGLMVLGGLVVFFLVTSWRKWPDPLIDFGCEIYSPWRLANGAVLYRDIDCFYGPLSKYFNAVLFKCFGTGLIVLVTANLVVFAAILVVVYGLCRRAWGAGPALAASAVFIAVFGFSQFVRTGNYNYATPYAHEATHGFLICLLLVILLVRCVEEATLRRSFFAGGLFGLTAVLKPEIMLAAGLITFTMAVMQWWHRKQLKLSTIVAWAGGAALPTLGFIVYFAAYLPWKEAVRVSCTAWLNVATNTRSSSVLLQEKFLGFDSPWKHLLEHLSATLLACVLIAVIAGAAWLAERTTQRRLRLLFGGLLVGALLWLACFEITWGETGRCLLGAHVNLYNYQRRLTDSQINSGNNSSGTNHTPVAGGAGDGADGTHGFEWPHLPVRLLSGCAGRSACAGSFNRRVADATWNGSLRANHDRGRQSRAVGPGDDFSK